MQGQLGKLLFADLIRHLSRENATGRLRITHGADTIEVFFESGVPITGTSTLPDEQIEYRLVRDGLVDAEQIKSAWLAASESSRGIDAVLVESGSLAAETLEQGQRAVSLGVINAAFEWYTGDYEFVAEPASPTGAKLTWTAAECILTGARHASSSDTILDVIASDYKIVCPAPESASSVEHSASLSSVEGYVLSCIQSPVTIWEASSVTGLSQIETRRALFVLILLGLLVEQRAPSDQTVTGQQHTGSQKDTGSVQQAGSQIPAEDPPTAVQWCPVEYAIADGKVQRESADPPDHGQSTGPEDSFEFAWAESQIADPCGEEAVYRQRLDLEERLDEASADGECAVADQRKNGPGKSLAIAIQELNIKLRLAAPTVPDQPPIVGSAAGEQNGDLLIEESRRLQAPPIFEEPLRLGEQAAVEEPPSLPHRDKGGDERFLKKIILKLDARLAAAASRDYYQLLGVDRLASNGSITRSYKEMVALYDGYEARWSENRELKAKVTEFMHKIGRAYETLGKVERRRVYDMPAGKEGLRRSGEEQCELTDRKDARPVHMRHPQPLDIEPGDDARRPRAWRKTPVPLPIPRWGGKSKRSASSPRGADGTDPDLRNPYEAAEEYYKRGRAMYERSDLHIAAHLLREAIKLDGNRSSYHYQLGVVLSTLSQARKEHKHPKGCHVTCRLGGLLARNQRVRREAERHLLKAAELDPSNPEIKLRLGLLYKDAALDQKSQQYFYEALMLDANSELARLGLGLDRETKTNEPTKPVKKKGRRRSSRK
jgi:tetratricopeptide (TPR) repeat protein